MITPDKFSAALAVLGATGFLTAILPAMDKLIDAEPGNPEMRARLDSAQAVFMLGAGALVCIGATVYRSWFVFIVGMALIAMRLTYERAALNNLITGARPEPGDD